MKKSTKKSFKPKKANLTARDLNPEKLVALQDQLCVGQTLRFVTTNNFAGSVAITTTNLLDAWYLAGTATNAYQLFDFVRLKRVTIRGMAVALDRVAGSVNASPPSCTVAIEFFGLVAGSLSGGKQKSDTSLGYMVPAMVTLVPDPKSSMALFQQASGNALFVVRAVDQSANPLQGCVIDVEVVYRNSADVNPAALATARAGMQPGALYFNGLDGLTDAATAVRSTFVPRI